MLSAHAGSMDIYNATPSQFTAGDTLRWTVDLPAYPADAGWVLKYMLVNAESGIEITAVADGASHLVDQAMANTASWAVGDYAWQAVVEGSGERHTVGTGRIRVLMPLLGLSATETRSQARRILDALLAAYESYVGNGGHVGEYQIAGRTMKFRSAEEIIKQINYWRAQVAREEAAAAMAAGRRPGRVFTRFDR